MQTVEGLMRDLEEFTADRLKHGDLPDAGSCMPDPVWGTMYFHPWEVAMISTPLLQRLRFVRQTSLAYLAFPAATHSRFEHSLGTATVAERMMSSMNSRHGQIFDRAGVYAVRLAALMHDVGHTLLSHSGERIAGKHEVFRQLRQRDARFAGPGVHELLSYCIVTAAAFRSYFDSLRERYASVCPELRGLSLDEVAAFIIGAGEGDRRLLADIVNGAFDSDKMDYLARDSLLTGVRATHDATRLFYSLEPVRIVCEESAGGAYRLFASTDKSVPSRLAVGMGGVAVVEDLLFSKVMIAKSVHMNPVVRASDVAVKQYFRFLGNNSGDISPGRRFDRPLDFLERSNDSAVFAETQDSQGLRQMARALQEGRLHKPALVLSRTTCSGLDQLLRFQGEEELLDRLAFQIYERAIQSCPIHELTMYDVSIDLPRIPSLREASHVVVVLEDGHLTFLDQIIPIGNWLGSYAAFNWRGMVFAPDGPDSQRLWVARAARECLEDLVGLKFNDLCWSEAGLSPEKVMRVTG